MSDSFKTVRVYHKYQEQTCFCAKFIIIAHKKMQNDTLKAIYVKNRATFVKY